MTHSLRYALLGLIPAGLLAAPPENPPANSPMKVEVQNFPELQDVAVVPRRGYMLKAAPGVSIPFASHLNGALLSLETSGAICRGTLSYVDQSVRPGGANTNDIATFNLSHPRDTTGGASLYVPLPNLLLPEGVELLYSPGTGCSGAATLYLTPVNTGIGGPGDIGF